jgi:N-acetyl-anhydromuramyl-L-alanine amidase AmpD
MNIREIKLSPNQYFNDPQQKRQIVGHHSASGDIVENVVHGWETDPDRVGTAYLVNRSGQIFKTFDDAAWAWHLGMRHPRNIIANKQSIGIELTNWGFLTKVGDKFYHYKNREVPQREVITYTIPFKGCSHFQAYTPAQIAAFRELNLMLADKYNIPTHYQGYDNLFKLSNKAIIGEKGIFTHNSYRADKTDLHPQPEMIEIFKNLK